ncbi:MAG TPA: hypothetical protein VGM73_10305 [Candidatus Didemnitutus sp.]
MIATIGVAMENGLWGASEEWTSNLVMCLFLLLPGLVSALLIGLFLCFLSRRATSTIFVVLMIASLLTGALAVIATAVHIVPIPCAPEASAMFLIPVLGFAVLEIRRVRRIESSNPIRWFYQRAMVVAIALAGLVMAVLPWVRRRHVRNEEKLPPALQPLVDRSIGHYVARLADIPAPVMVAIRRDFPVFRHQDDGQLPSLTSVIAEPQGRWNSTDMADRRFPMRRLIWGASVGDCFVLHYEQGGMGHSYLMAIFAPVSDGQMRLQWHEYVGQRYWSIASMVHRASVEAAAFPTYGR